MSLIKSLELPSGVTGEYWKIVELVFDYLGGTAECIVKLYKDAAARAANKDPLQQVQYVWSGSDFTGWFDAATLDTADYNPQERAYEKLKTLPEFSGATDG